MASLDDALKERMRDRGGAPAEGTQPSSFGQVDTNLSLDEQLRQKMRERGQHVPTQRQAETGSRQEFLSRQVEGAPLGEPGMEDIGLRADLGLSDTFEEKKAKFLDQYPDGDFVLVNEPPKRREQALDLGRGGTTILFRRNDNEPYAELDAQALEKFEFLGDLADLSGDVPQAVAEAVITRGAGLVRQLVQIFTGSVLGESAKETVEELRGYQKESLPELVGRIGMESGIAATGGAATVAVTGPINVLRGSANIRLTAGAREAQRAAQELGVPAPLATQISDHPILQKLGNQSAATVPTIGRYMRDQQRSMVDAVLSLTERDAGQFALGQIQDVHERARNQIIEAAQKSTSLSEGGAAIQEGIADYDSVASAAVNRLYSEARNMETPEFDVTGAFDVAEEVVNRLQGVNTPEAQRIRSLAEMVLNMDPNLPPQQFITTSGRKALERARDRLDVAQRSGDQVEIQAAQENLDSVQSEVIQEIDATDQLRRIRSIAWDLKTPNPGEIARQPEKEAGRIFAALNRTLDNPTGAGDEFVQAWRTANQEAAKRFDTMEKLIVVQAAKSETPAVLANRLAKPLQVDNLRLLKETIPKNRYQVFQSAAMSDFIAPNNVDSLTRRLNSFDRETLNELFTPEQQVQLRDIGQKIDRLNAVGINDVLQKQASRANAIRDLVRNGDEQGIRTLLESTADNPEARRQIRAGLIDNIVNRARTQERGDPRISRAGLRSELEALRENGAIQFLTREDIQALENVNLLTDFIRENMDTGASLMAGEVVSGMRQMSASAMVTLLTNIGTGRFVTNRLGKRLLIGKGKEPLRFNGIRVLGAVLADVNSDIQQEQQSERGQNR